MANPKKLTHEQMDTAFDMILNLERHANIAKALGFSSRAAFLKYLIKDQEFFELCERARATSCWTLEEQLLDVADDYGKDVARVKMDSLAKILKYRDPKRYGDKLDMSVQHTIDISGSLERAEKRVLETTVNPITLLVATNKDP